MAVEPHAYALATLADLKEWLGFTDDVEVRDDFLQKQINKATDTLETETGRKLKKRDYTDGSTGVYTHGNATDTIDLTEWPLHSVAEVTINDVVRPATEYYADPAGMVRLKAGRVSEGVDNLRVKFTAGYDPVPGDLEDACMELAAHKYRRSGFAATWPIGLKARSHGDTSETFSDDNKKLIPTAVQMVIDRYARREWIPHRAHPASSVL